MAELLIKAVDTTHSDKIKDLRGCYKKGYVVVVKPDNWSWGKEELNKEKFYILRVKDAKVEDLQYLTQTYEIELGSYYDAFSEKLGVFTSLSNQTEAYNDCLNKCRIVAQELAKFGINVSESEYNIKVKERQVKYPLIRRRYKLDISEIEEELKKGIVEIELKDLKIIDQRK